MSSAGAKKGRPTLLAWVRPELFKKQTCELVDGRKLCEVSCVCSCRTEDEACLFADSGTAPSAMDARNGQLEVNARSRSEKQYHAVLCPSVFGSPTDNMVGIHKRMWKSHFRSVDGAIAGGFCDSEDVVVFGVEDDALGSGLCREQSAMASNASLRPCRRTLRPSRALDIVPRQFGWTSWRGSKLLIRCAEHTMMSMATSPHWKDASGSRGSIVFGGAGETEVRGEKGGRLTTETISMCHVREHKSGMTAVVGSLSRIWGPRELGCP